MVKKHFNNISKEYEDMIDYISPKIKIDEEWDIKVLEHITKWEILLKGENLHDEYWVSWSPDYTIVWEPYDKWNVQFIDKTTVQAIKDIKKWGYITFADDERHKPLLFRAPNKFVYQLSLAIVGIIFAFIQLAIVFFIYTYFWGS